MNLVHRSRAGDSRTQIRGTGGRVIGVGALLLVLVFVLTQQHGALGAAPLPSQTATRVYGQNGSFTNETYNCTGTIPSGAGLCDPHDTTLDAAGGLYVTQFDANRVMHFPMGSTTPDAVYGQGGSLSTTCNIGGESAGSLCHPTAAVVGPNGGLYVTDEWNNRVLYYPPPVAGTDYAQTTATQVYGQNGSFTTGAQTICPVPGNPGLPCTPRDNCNPTGESAAGLCSPSGVAVTGDGGLYIVDQNNNRVLYYPPPAAATGYAQTTPTHVYGQTGSFTTGYGTCNTGRISANSLCTPGRATVDADGGLYISDGADNRVLYYPPPLAGTTFAQTTATQIYGQNGSFTASGCNTGGESAARLCYPYGLALDAAGGLFVADYDNERVLHFPASSTTADAVYGQSGSFTTGFQRCNAGGESAATLCAPVGVTVDSQGSLYIADSGNNRVLYFPASPPANTVTPTSTVSATNTPVPTPSTLPSQMPSIVYGQGGDFTTSDSGTSAGSFYTPYSVALDGSGGLYVAEANNSRVLHFPPGSTTPDAVYGQNGSFTTGSCNDGGVSAASLCNPEGIAVDSVGGLYVADFHNYRVLYYPPPTSGTDYAGVSATKVYGQDGLFTTQNGGSTAGTFNGPAAVAPDDTGGLYVADTGNQRVLHFSANSTIADAVYGQNGSFTSGGEQGTTATTMQFPNGLAVDGSGNLYVADSQNNRVLYFPASSPADAAQETPSLVYGQNGSFTSAIGGTSSTTFVLPYGIAMDASGGLFVTDFGNSRVLHFPANSTTADAVYGQGGSFNSRAPGTGPTSFRYPLDVTVDATGGLYVADSNNNRVLYFPSSAPSSTATPTGTATSTPTLTVTIAANTDTPTDSPTNTESPTATATETATDTFTPVDTSTATATPTYTLTATDTLTGTPTDTPVPPSPTATGTATATATDTDTSTATATDTATETPTDTYTNTSTATASDTSLPTGTPTNTPTMTATTTPSDTDTSTYTPVPATPTATETATESSTSTATLTRTNTPTYTRTATATFTSTATNTSTSTNTKTPTATICRRCTATRTATRTPINTATRTATRTITVTRTPTNTRTATGTPTSTATRTPTRTSTVTKTPTRTVTKTATRTSTATKTPRPH